MVLQVQVMYKRAIGSKLTKGRPGTPQAAQPVVSLQRGEQEQVLQQKYPPDYLISEETRWKTPTKLSIATITLKRKNLSVQRVKAGLYSELTCSHPVSQPSSRGMTPSSVRAVKISLSLASLVTMAQVLVSTSLLQQINDQFQSTDQKEYHFPSILQSHGQLLASDTQWRSPQETKQRRDINEEDGEESMSS